MNHLILVPTYGRNPKSKKELLDLWNGNKDFSMADFQNHGRKINKADFMRYLSTPELQGVTKVKFRYNKLQSVAVVTICRECGDVYETGDIHGCSIENGEEE